MRPLIDATFVALLLLTTTAYLVAERPGASMFWALLTIATVKSVLIQAVFMQLTRSPLILIGLTSASLCVAVGVGLLLGA